jgi:hypothetical protein
MRMLTEGMTALGIVIALVAVGLFAPEIVTALRRLIAFMRGS